MGLQQESDDVHSSFIELMQNRLNWSVETERYEMAARLRDLIEYETTEDKNIKNKYYLQLLNKYAPDFYEVVKHKYKQI
jgi:hypothetical protein